MTLEACADLVRRGDPERFRAVMAAPVPARAMLFPIYAFNVEVSRAPWVTAEPMIAEMRLQWWRDALAEIAEGGLVRRHEVVTPLAQVLSRDQAGRLDALVEARRSDIARAPFQDGAALDAYLAQTGGLLTAITAEALGSETTKGAAVRGHAAAVANWLRAVPALEARGKVPLVDGRPQVVAELAGQALLRWRSAPACSRAERIATLAAWQAPLVLARAARAPQLVAEGRLDPAPLRASAALVRAAWGL